MRILDTNIILRYLLNDHEILSPKSIEIFEQSETILFSEEVIVEIVYVLQKLYKVPRLKIKENLKLLLNLPNVEISKYDIVMEAISVYSKSNLDYVDCVLYSYAKLKKIKVETFDEELLKSLNKNLY